MCAAILDFLNGWALVSFLATCKSARGCHARLRLVLQVKAEVQALNLFLAAVAMQSSLRLPGFGPSELVEARLVPMDPSKAKPSRAEQRLMREALMRNPAHACDCFFAEWLEENWPEDLEPTMADVGGMVLLMNGQGQPLAGSLALAALARVLKEGDPFYAPTWTRVSASPSAASGLAAEHYPAVLYIYASCRGFPVAFFATSAVMPSERRRVVID